MNEFDQKAAGWDKNQMHRERAEAVAAEIIRQIPLTRKMSALEFGAGTGLLSFTLRDHIGTITLVDNSEGMVKVLLEKTSGIASPLMKVVKIDLETETLAGETFDLLYTMMVLHHVTDVEKIISRFSDMIRPGGHLAIADLHSEDGSFHGDGFPGHRGFDTGVLASLLEKHGFMDICYKDVFTIDRLTADNSIKQFGVFLMTALRK